jgi:hypothetical protein
MDKMATRGAKRCKNEGTFVKAGPDTEEATSKAVSAWLMYTCLPGGKGGGRGVNHQGNKTMERNAKGALARHSEKTQVRRGLMDSVSQLLFSCSGGML